MTYDLRFTIAGVERALNTVVNALQHKQHKHRLLHGLEFNRQS
jgi:hypothetical protein